MPQNHAQKEDDFLKMADDSILLRRRTLYPAELLAHICLLGFAWGYCTPFLEKSQWRRQIDGIFLPQQHILAGE